MKIFDVVAKLQQQTSFSMLLEQITLRRGHYKTVDLASSQRCKLCRDRSQGDGLDTIRAPSHPSRQFACEPLRKRTFGADPDLRALEVFWGPDHGRRTNDNPHAQWLIGDYTNSFGRHALDQEAHCGTRPETEIHGIGYEGLLQLGVSGKNGHLEF